MKSEPNNTSSPLNSKSFFLILFLILTFLGGHNAWAQAISASERTILMELYSATNGSGWTSKTNWGTDNYPWYGVTVTGGTVTAIRLDLNNLSGTIPESIGQLINLETIILQNNSISGSIPLSIYSLNKLQYLDLSFNSLSGTLSPNISKLKAIQEFNLSGNSISGSIPPGIGADTTLKKLDLSFNSMSGAIPSTVGDLVYLETLSLNNNRFTNQISTNFAKLINLSHLSLSDNLLTGEIPKAIFGLTKLTGLYLANNGFSGVLPPEIGNLTRLQFLNLQNSGLSGALPSTLKYLTKLSIFNISENGFTGFIPVEFRDFVFLRDFRINNNQIDSIPALTRLTTFMHCDSNKLDFEDLEPNASLIATLGADFIYSPQAEFGTERTYNKVEGNTFTLTIPCKGTKNHYTWYKDGVIIPVSDGNSLFFESIRLDDEGDYYIRVTNDLLPGLTLQSKVVHLIVSEHCLRKDSSALVLLFTETGGANWKHKDNWLRSGSRLRDWYGIDADSCHVTRVELGNNNLKGTIPTAIGEMQELRVFSVPDNNLTGELPVGMWSLTSLDTLNVERNRMSGKLTSAVGNLTDLVYLGLSSNNFDGAIPPEIANLAKLEQFRLDSNRFEDVFPSELISLAYLKYVGLSHNRISGSITSTIGNLKKLEWLRLDDNLLTGGIPAGVWNLPNLMWLGLSENQLTGVLPPEVGQPTKLKGLALASNQFTGTIPQEMGNLVGLNYLSLGNNGFEGDLPSSIGNLSNLQYADFASNAFTGDVPSAMGSFSDLEFLYLNDNSFVDMPAFLQVDSVMITQNNKFTFEDFEQNLPLQRKSALEYEYAPQQKFNREYDTLAVEGNPFTLTIPCGGQYNHYTWYKDGAEMITGPDAASLTFPRIKLTDAGTYHIVVVNDSVTDAKSAATNLILTSFPVHLNVIEHCIKSDSLALVALYQATNGPGWINNENWLVAGKRVHDWFGIESDSCNITGVVLENNGLVGAIPFEIGRLSQLVTLDLAQNSLSGPVTDSLYNLNNLELLNLGFNQLSGKISNDIGQLKSLRKLLLNDNSFDGEIPTTIDNLNQLQELNLGGNLLSGILPDQLWNLTKLQKLSLYDNEFSGEFSSMVGKLTALEELRIDSNYFEGELPSVMGQMSALNKFQFNENLIDEIPQMSNIDSSLFSQYNYLTFEDFERNLEAIHNTVVDFQYSPQYPFGRAYDTVAYRKYPFSLTIPCGGQYNHYEWYKDGEHIPSAPDSSTLTIAYVDYSDAGDYFITVTNDSVPNLVLYSQTVKVIVEKGPPLPISLINLVIIDGSHNPNFVIENIDDYPENELSVFTKWGKRVYRQEGYNNELDFSDYPAGTYYFVLKYTTTTSGPVQVKNFVDVIKK